jgi:hypothetical protein
MYFFAEIFFICTGQKNLKFARFVVRMVLVDDNGDLPSNSCLQNDDLDGFVPKYETIWMNGKRKGLVLLVEKEKGVIRKLLKRLVGKGHKIVK